MKEYEKFIAEYKKVADEILSQTTALEAVRIIEENLPRIHELSTDLEDYLKSIDELPVQIKSNKRWVIHQELDSISKPVSNLNSKFQELFDKKGTEYYWDKEIGAIIKLFCHYTS